MTERDPLQQTNRTLLLSAVTSGDPSPRESMLYCVCHIQTRFVSFTHERSDPSLTIAVKLSDGVRIKIMAVEPREQKDKLLLKVVS